MMPSARVPFVGAVVILLGLAPPSAAVADEASADALLAQGKDLDKAGKTSEAHEKLMAAWRLGHRYDVAAALGLNEKKSGDVAHSAQHLEYAIRFLPDPAKPGTGPSLPWAKPDERQQLVDAFTDVRSKVAAVRLRVLPDVSGVNIDGEKPELLGLDYDVFVMPGSRSVEIPNHPSQSIETKGGGSYTVTSEDPLPHEKRAAPSAPSAPVESTAAPKPAWPTVVLATLAAGGIGVGIGMTVVAQKKSSDARALAKTGGCAGAAGPTTSCIASGSKLVSDHNTFQAIGIAGFVGGGVALTGTLIYALWPSAHAGATVQAAFDPAHRGGFVGVEAPF